MSVQQETLPSKASVIKQIQGWAKDAVAATNAGDDRRSFQDEQNAERLGATVGMSKGDVLNVATKVFQREAGKTMGVDPITDPDVNEISFADTNLNQLFEELCADDDAD